jgi:hypothetical protein
MRATTTDESGDLDGTVIEKQAPRPTLKIPSVGDVLKFSGIAGGVMYAALFLGYRKYYDILGVRPEDVGVNNTFILVRSIGFVLLAAISTASAILLTVWFSRAMKGSWNLRKAIHKAIHIFLVGSAFVLITTACLVKVDKQAYWLPGLIAAVLTVGCIAMARFTYRSRHDRSIALAGLAVTAGTIIFVPAVVAIVSAYHRADMVKQGNPITPAVILGIPILDVSADEVQITWICPDSQRPPIFTQSKDNPPMGILVGETSTSYYIRWGNQSQSFEIVKLPQSCALLTHT